MPRGGDGCFQQRAFRRHPSYPADRQTKRVASRHGFQAESGPPSLARHREPARCSPCAARPDEDDAMTERPRAGKLLPGGPVLRDATVSPLSLVDAEFRRLGEALSAGIEGDHVAALVAAIDELRNAAGIIPEAELSRRIGSGLVLLGSAYEQIGNQKDAVVAFRRAMTLLAHVGLEDLPA